MNRSSDGKVEQGGSPLTRVSRGGDEHWDEDGHVCHLLTNVKSCQAMCRFKWLDGPQPRLLVLLVCRAWSQCQQLQNWTTRTARWSTVTRVRKALVWLSGLCKISSISLFFFFFLIDGTAWSFLLFRGGPGSMFSVDTEEHRFRKVRVTRCQLLS